METNKNLDLIAKLYPDLTPEEGPKAQQAMHRYVNLVWRIYQRIRNEKQ